MKTFICTVVVVLLSVGQLVGQKGTGKEAGHTGTSDLFGVSGGNIYDSANGWCCSGTLGAMLVDSNGTRYVLSNNHVLARQGQAKPGETISQPGLIDSNCKPSQTVATFTAAPPLGSNVDAAVGTLSAMHPNGFIMDVGVPSSDVRPPAIGLLVTKSGRTTGLTTGKVTSISTSVRVGYSDSCGSRTTLTVNYTNQIVVTGTKFSAGGDSGSLIVTNDANHQPVALLFAGGGSSTIGNPIGQVLTAVSDALGRPVGFLPQSLQAAMTLPTGGPSNNLVEHAKYAKNSRERELLNLDGVIGVGVGGDEISPGEAFIHVYIDQTKGKEPNVPSQIDGVRVKKIKTEPFIAYGCCDRCRP